MCKEYSNKALKEQAYAELTQYVKTFDPQASKDTALTATVLPILFNFVFSFLRTTEIAIAARASFSSDDML